MNELTLIEMHATAAGTSVENLPSLAPAATLLEALAALAARQQQAGSLFLQRLSD